MRNTNLSDQYDDHVLHLLEQAEDLKFNGQFDAAIKILQQIIIVEPTCTEAYEELGDNYLSTRELKKSEKALKQALKLDSHSANAHYLMGFLLSLQEKWGKSVEELEQADSMFPNHPEILRCLGWSFYNNNRKAQGVAVLERSAELNPEDPSTLCDLGVCYMNSLQYEKAKKAFSKVIKIDPNFGEVQEYLSVINGVATELDKKGGRNGTKNC